LYAHRDPCGFEQLQHYHRSGHVEVTRESFRPADGRRELAEAGSLYLPRGIYNRVARISSGREGYRTPTGRFQVIRKDEDHRSSVYGDYVDGSGRIVKANVDSRRDSKPPHAHFVGAPMPYFLEFLAGLRIAPGLPARGACVARMH